MRIFLSITFLLIISRGYAQFGAGDAAAGAAAAAGNASNIIYEVTKTFGNDSAISNAGNITAFFKYDSIGSYWNMPTENDYLRFKILHFYILNGRKGGERWKEKYYITKKILNKKFDDYMRSRLKKKKFKIATDYPLTDYILNIYFVDKSIDIQRSDLRATYQFIDNKTGAIVLQYNVQQTQKLKISHRFEDSYGRSKTEKQEMFDDSYGTPITKKQGETTFIGLSVAMLNYLKKHPKK